VASWTGGALYNMGSAANTIRNSILRNSNPSSFMNIEISGGTNTVTHSNVRGGAVGTGNIDADPLFINAGAGDLRLQSNSPSRHTGAATDAPAEDIRGVSRPQGAGYDMGAYEMTASDYN